MTNNDSGASDKMDDDAVAKSVAPTTTTDSDSNNRGSTNRSSNSLARRQMIKSALAAVPVVLTITAGTAKAQGDSLLPSPGTYVPDEEDEGDSESEESPQAGSGSSSSIFSSKPFADSPMGPLESGDSGSDN